MLTGGGSCRAVPRRFRATHISLARRRQLQLRPRHPSPHRNALFCVPSCWYLVEEYPPNSAIHARSQASASIRATAATRGVPVPRYRGYLVSERARARKKKKKRGSERADRYRSRESFDPPECEFVRVRGNATSGQQTSEGTRRSMRSFRRARWSDTNELTVGEGPALRVP